MAEKDEDVLGYIMELLERMSESYILKDNPVISSNLVLGSNNVVYDANPKTKKVIHGYEVGWSGDTSFMVVQRNDTGIGCPLYMTKKNKWDQCTAEHGTKHMPCMALALDEDAGFTEIMWKGILRKGSWAWTSGDLIYVSTVEGALTNIKPIDGSWAQIVGMALSETIIRFDPGFYAGFINL